MPDSLPPHHAAQPDVVIAGAGFAGMYLLHRLRALGLRVRVFEAGHDVGGTWYWNRYPGARCDVESMQYSFSFDPELQQSWSWSERYAAQPEILTYAQHIAERLDLRRDITFNTRVTALHFDDAAQVWHVTTDTGEALAARFCVMATGCLSTTKLPEIPGIQDFAGATYHTGQWPHEGVDFTGQRVGVIGTGSSAIQAIPVIAQQAAHLTVFQRTPNFSVPAHNWPMRPDYEGAWKAEYPERRARAKQVRNGILMTINPESAVAVDEAARQKVYEERWQMGGTQFMGAFGDLILNRESNETAAEFVRGKIRSIVKDKTLAELLCPQGYPIGTKRICVDTGYYETYNRGNVSLVDLRAAPIEAITPQGVRTTAAEYAFDSLVFATGFDAMTGTILAVDIQGRGGQTLRAAWAEGPRTYLGLMVAGFPNLFTITGPGSPSVLTNMLVSIEQHVDWITTCLATLQDRGAASIEATQAAQDDWAGQVAAAGNRTLYPNTASWYAGANVPGKPRVFMPYIGGVPAYHRICAEVAAEGYRGFAIRAMAEADV